MKKFSLGAWGFATIALFTMIGLRLFNPEVFWDIINAFTTGVTAMVNLF